MFLNIVNEDLVSYRVMNSSNMSSNEHITTLQILWKIVTLKYCVINYCSVTVVSKTTILSRLGAQYFKFLQFD